ncbi:MAG: 4Fe-4S dicluster domain-containing protein [Desulfobacteraceae bacterium]|nr:MAG: 4Fe-4S dicluster domain-containing protein [Desulfobacteraceae bacterium]
MLSKPFFGYARPKFNYELLSTALPQAVTIAISGTVTLLLPREMGPNPSTLLKPGMRVRTGQRLTWDEKTAPSVVSSVTGTITGLHPHLGDYGRKYTGIVVATEAQDEWDDGFSKACAQLDIQVLSDFLAGAPGAPPLAKLVGPKTPVQTIIIYGGDTDLMVDTNLYVLKSQTAMVDKGIHVLKQVTGVQNIILAVPGESLQTFDGHFGAEVRAVPNIYPYGQPLMLFYQLFGRVLQQGQTFENQGVVFMRAEAAAAIGKAVAESRIPIEKMVTVLDKQGRKKLVSARIGTPIGAILKTLDINLDDRDRLVFGGPMTGTAVYSEEQPIQSDTDAIMAQDGGEIVLTSDYPCINCGECVRICPSRVSVNMLVRYLEAGQYQDSADLYDLYSCVECGVCSIVCPSRIPILQYIKLAKFELARALPAEEDKND